MGTARDTDADAAAAFRRCSTNGIGALTRRTRRPTLAARPDMKDGPVVAHGPRIAEIARVNLMAALAHELRVPLSVMQGKLEGLLDGVYSWNDTHLRRLLEETEVLSRLIEDLRTLALSESYPLHLPFVDLTDVGSLARATRRESPRQGQVSQSLVRARRQI